MASVLVLVPLDRTLRPSFFRRFFLLVRIGMYYSFLPCSGERMEFRYRTPCCCSGITALLHKLMQTRQAEILFSVTEFDGDNAGNDRTRHDQWLIAKRALRKSVLIVEDWTDFVNGPLEPRLRIRLRRESTILTASL